MATSTTRAARRRCRRRTLLGRPRRIAIVGALGPVTTIAFGYLGLEEVMTALQMLGSALVLFFINKATQPLRDLHDAAESVGRGDFSKRLMALSTA